MEILADVLEKIFGNVHFFVYVGKKPAIEIIFNNKTITVEIVNPILAIEAGIDQIIRRHPGEFDSKRLGAFKNLGYKIRIKYKFLEFEL